MSWLLVPKLVSEVVLTSEHPNQHRKMFQKSVFRTKTKASKENQDVESNVARVTASGYNS